MLNRLSVPGEEYEEGVCWERATWPVIFFYFATFFFLNLSCVCGSMFRRKDNLVAHYLVGGDL